MEKKDGGRNTSITNRMIKVVFGEMILMWIPLLVFFAGWIVIFTSDIEQRLHLLTGILSGIVCFIILAFLCFCFIVSLRNALNREK